jgi:integrase
MPKEALDHQRIKAMTAPDKRISIYDTVESGLGLRISRKGKKTFFYRYRFGGRNRRFTLGPFPAISLKAARSKVRELKVDVHNGIDPQAVKKDKKRESDSKTFKDLAEYFKEKHLPTLKETTQSEYERIIDNELVPPLGKYHIEDITINEIIPVLDKKAYKDDSPTMANRMRARLSRIFTFAMERGLAEKNPVDSTSTYSNGNKTRDRYYSENEIKILWEFFEDQKEPTQSVLKMLLICGQRKTETMKMKWSDINDGVWTIPATLAKNNKAHNVPLPKMALEIIEKMRPISGKSDYVFKSPQKDNEPIGWLSRARRHIQNHSSVSDFRPHDLRRTMATYMAKMGVDRTVLGKILNHKGLAGDSHVTAIYDRYSYAEEKKEALENWSTFLEKLLYDEND